MSTKTGKKFLSTKTYTHAEGLSCCFRQWRAESHCRFLHGYALEVRVVFGCSELDDRNWVVDFGGLKEFKAWLKDTFDHKTLVAKDDPMIGTLNMLGTRDIQLAQISIVDKVGCEAFAEMIFDEAEVMMQGLDQWVESVEVKEHAGNSAICKRVEDPCTQATHYTTLCESAEWKGE